MVSSDKNKDDQKKEELVEETAPLKPSHESPLAEPSKPDENGDGEKREAKSEDDRGEESPERQWFVLRVQSGKEDKVKANLVKRVESMGLQDKIFQIVVPGELISEIRKGFKRVSERKLYPGYVMIEMIKTEETYYMVKSTPGVGDFAGAMSRGEIERMLLTCGHSGNKPKPKVLFHKGQNIKIKEGAFENYDGIIDEVNEQKGIVKVRIGIFGRYTQVELSYWQVESI